MYNVCIRHLRKWQGEGYSCVVIPLCDLLQEIHKIQPLFDYNLHTLELLELIDL